jgi:hypothetical protein
MGENLDVIGRLGPLRQNFRYGSAGRIRRVDDTPVTVASLSCEMKLPVIPEIEIDPLVDQPLYTAATVSHGKFHCISLAQTIACCQCVVHMRVYGIPGV